MTDKPYVEIYKEPQKPLSKQKLLEYLKSAKIDSSYITYEPRYMYTIGRNMLADVLIAGIIMGDFDEDEKN